MATNFLLSNGIEISHSDDRAYKFVDLGGNGAKALVVSDPTSTSSAAACEVSVGSFSDPAEVPGLAHFAEHMCFLGTTSYPDENSFGAFLNTHAGYSNAYTSASATNYHFTCQRGGFKEALHRFSTFFTEPLMTASATARELKAVDAEHAKNLQNDMWRAYQLDKTTSNPAHPYQKFGTGDSTTLETTPKQKGIDVRQLLLEFVAAHYSASRITIAVLSAEPVDTLEAWVKEYFAGLKNNGSSEPNFADPPHPYVEPPGSSAGHYSGIVQWMVPVKDSRSISLSWPLPEVHTVWRSKPDRVLNHLLGHEGAGSLLSYLKAAGWATALSGGIGDSEKNYSVLTVSIDLTESGLDHTEEVTCAVFAYIGLLRACGGERLKWVHDELAQQNAVSFRFSSKGQPEGYVVQLAEALRHYPPAQVLSGRWLVSEWKPQQLDDMLALLTPAGCRIRIVAKAKAVADKCTLREKWYQTAYGQAPLTPQQLSLYAQAADGYAAITQRRIAASAGGAVLPMGGAVALSGGEGAEAETAARAAVAAEAKACEAAEPGSGLAAAWSAEVAALFPPLTLPAPNHYIPSDFELRNDSVRAKVAARLTASEAPAAADATTTDDATTTAAPRSRKEPVPILLRDDPFTTAFFHQDDHFGVPKLYVVATLLLPAGGASARGQVCADLFATLAQEALAEESYAAAMADLQGTVSSLPPYGIRLTLRGFSHKMRVLAAVFASKVARLTFTEEQFDIQKDRIARRYANFALEMPIRHAGNAASYSTTTQVYPVAERLAAIAGVTAADLRSYMPLLLQQMRVQVMCAGNATEAEAGALVDAIVTPLQEVAAASFPSTAIAATPRALALPQPLTVTVTTAGVGAGAGAAAAPAVPLELVFVHKQPAPNPADPNVAMTYCVQLGQEAPLLQLEPAAAATAAAGSGGLASRPRVMAEVLGHLLSDPFFDKLRTQQTLGYIVNAASHTDIGVSYLRFQIQSNKVSAEELVVRTDTFLAAYRGELAAMPEEVFAGHIAAIISQKLEDAKNLHEQLFELLSEVSFNGLYDFKRVTSEVALLRQLSKGEVLAAYDACVAPGGSARRVFIALVDKGDQAAAGGAGGEGEEGGEEEEEEEEEAAEQPAQAAAAAAADAALPAAAAEVAAAAATSSGSSNGSEGIKSPTQPPSPATIAASAEGGPAREDSLAPAPAADAATAAPPPVAAPQKPSAWLQWDFGAAAALLQQINALTGAGAGKAGVVDAALLLRMCKALGLPTAVQPSFPGATATAAASASSNGDLASVLAATSTAATLRARVDVSSYLQMRTALPALPDAPRLAFELWKRNAPRPAAAQ